MTEKVISHAEICFEITSFELNIYGWKEIEPNTAIYVSSTSLKSGDALKFYVFMLHSVNCLKCLGILLRACKQNIWLMGYWIVLKGRASLTSILRFFGRTISQLDKTLPSSCRNQLYHQPLQTRSTFGIRLLQMWMGL